MIQVYANWLVQLMDDLRGLELRAKHWTDTNSPPDAPNEAIADLIKNVAINVRHLNLRSSIKQMLRLHDRIASGTCRTSELSSLVAELRVRIVEDLGDRAFYCVNDPQEIEEMFIQEAPDRPGGLRIKRPDEIFDPVILSRFGDCVDDLEQAIRCYIFSCYTACVFHLMKVVEQGVREVAVLAGLTDDKPSWGAVLNIVDKYAFRTEHKDLPAGVKPHRDLLTELSSEMHAIQRAWRNRVSHIENKLIPTREIDGPIAHEIMITVGAFMRSLAHRLPAKEAHDKQ